MRKITKYRKRLKVYSILKGRYYSEDGALFTLVTFSTSPITEQRRIKYLQNMINNSRRYKNILFVLIYINGKFYSMYPNTDLYVCYYYNEYRQLIYKKFQFNINQLYDCFLYKVYHKKQQIYFRYNNKYKSK